MMGKSGPALKPPALARLPLSLIGSKQLCRRGACRHSVAAHLAFLVATADLCCALDSACEPPTTGKCRKQQLSQALDRVTLRHLGTAGRQWQGSLSGPSPAAATTAGGGGCMPRPPRRWESCGARFRVMVWLRLRMPVMPSSDIACPLCDATCD